MERVPISPARLPLRASSRPSPSTSTETRAPSMVIWTIRGAGSAMLSHDGLHHVLIVLGPDVPDAGLDQLNKHRHRRLPSMQALRATRI